MVTCTTTEGKMETTNTPRTDAAHKTAAAVLMLPPDSFEFVTARFAAELELHNIELLESLRNTLSLAEAYYHTLPDDGPEQDHYMTSVIEPARAALLKARGK
jgi:hypothetical protein